MAVVTSAVVAAGASVYSASQSGSHATPQAQQPGNPNAVFGKPVKPVKYTSLWNKDPGFKNTETATINSNLSNLQRASDLSAGTNKAITASSMARVNGFDPTFMASMNQLYQNRNNELQGNLNYEDAMASVAGRGRTANDLGYAGGSGAQSAADLGLSRLDLQNHGASLAGSIQQILNGIDPVARYSTPQDSQISPSQAVPWQIADNQFQAQFKMQNNMLQAAANPAAAGMFNLQQFNAGLAAQGGANSARQFGQYAQAASQFGNAYGMSQYGGGGSTYGYSGGYSANSPANQMQADGNFYDTSGSVEALSGSSVAGV